MLIVETNPLEVERALLAGEFECPNCGGRLVPWWYGRWRLLRNRDGTEDRRRPRRARCTSCLVTHVLIPDDSLVRRRDSVEVIGEALTRSVAGVGFRKIATALGRPPETVRGWLRRCRSKAESIRSHFVTWLHALDPVSGPLVPGGSPLGDAVEVIGRVGIAAVLSMGPRPPWSVASRLTNGLLLSNTSSPWLSP